MGEPEISATSITELRLEGSNEILRFSDPCRHCGNRKRESQKADSGPRKKIKVERSLPKHPSSPDPFRLPNSALTSEMADPEISSTSSIGELRFEGCNEILRFSDPCGHCGNRKRAVQKADGGPRKKIKVEYSFSKHPSSPDAFRLPNSAQTSERISPTSPPFLAACKNRSSPSALLSVSHHSTSSFFQQSFLMNTSETIKTKALATCEKTHLPLVIAPASQQSPAENCEVGVITGINSPMAATRSTPEKCVGAIYADNDDAENKQETAVAAEKNEEVNILVQREGRNAFKVDGIYFRFF